ncbi:protein kibra [Episyrphus balteatus]|uniref:protein kibra n=1 Tax=Episyrphus balteatus TaxID=286459 RepID=UPI0024852C25|nr:protein kibra [Episyrphus balteatus]
MPKIHNHGEFPLPDGWDVAKDYDGKIYYIDHNTKKTTWLDPRDRYTKPQSFEDCIGDELPVGWEEAYDTNIGRYYINHISQTTQLEDPRQEWKSVQEAMLRDYLNAAQDVLEKKREMYDVKQQRLLIAQDEFNHLNTLAASRSSLCSSSSSINTRHDPDLLRADLVLAKERVRRLKQELHHINTDISYTQRGVNTLYSVGEKINARQNGCYDIAEVQAIREEMLKVQKSLVSGEKVREELMQSLVQIKNELSRQQYSEEAAADLLNATSPFDRVCVASQTDLCGAANDSMNSGARFAEMFKTKLQYSEWRKRIKQLQQQLADHVERIEPGQLESDKDRLLLIQEKEKLLTELKSIPMKSKSQQEILMIAQTRRKLEEDLNEAYEATNQCIANRLRLHEEKQTLLAKLQEALKSTKMLEERLKSFSSESTFSISSGSSLGSLSTASSKSALSFTDIYLDPLSVDPQIDVVDLHRRSQGLFQMQSAMSLSPRSSLSMETPPASPMKYTDAPKEEPTYANASNFNLPQQQQQKQKTPNYDLDSAVFDVMMLEEKLHDLKTVPINLAAPLSPIYEKPSLLDLPQDMLSRSSSTSNTRSVSAAVSNESVAGDSGVFEASRAHLPRKELAQVQIGLKYFKNEAIFVVSLERANNLAALLTTATDNSQVYLRAALLPNSLQSIRTKNVSDFHKPMFGDNFAVPISLSKLLTKNLHVTVICVTGQKEEIIGTVHISLAEFNADDSTLKWYNVLSSRFMPSFDGKEESSDESTITSSQTSTLTRNQAPPFEMQAQIAEELKEYLNLNDDAEEEDEEDEPEEEEEDATGGDYAELTRKMLDAYMNNVKQEYADKETNTECAFPPEKCRARLSDPTSQQQQQQNNQQQQSAIDDRPVKRSQTFTPSAAVGKSRYTCRLNRSDSDSAMHFGVTPHPFHRGAVERRSLRFHTKTSKPVTKLHHTHIPRTSLDLELDLQAQHSKLDFLNDEIIKLQNLKQTLEQARDNRDTRIATWAMENEEFQRLVERADPAKCPEEKQLQRLLHKTSKEIYKLRKTKVAKGSVDLVSFKEKIAFFTRKGLSVPELPIEFIVTEEDVIEEDEAEYENDGYSNNQPPAIAINTALVEATTKSQQQPIKNLIVASSSSASPLPVVGVSSLSASTSITSIPIITPPPSSTNNNNCMSRELPTYAAATAASKSRAAAAAAAAAALAASNACQPSTSAAALAAVASTSVTTTTSTTSSNTTEQASSTENSRFDYVVDRTYGVEV